MATRDRLEVVDKCIIESRLGSNQFALLWDASSSRARSMLRRRIVRQVTTATTAITKKKHPNAKPAITVS